MSRGLGIHFCCFYEENLQVIKERILAAEGTFKPNHRIGAPFGIAAGVTSTFAHGAGPVVTMFLVPQRLPKQIFVGTMVVGCVITMLIIANPRSSYYGGRLTVDLGPLGRRNVFSGISQSYTPEQLLGKHVVMFANLKPRTMRFGVSEGMIMAAGQSDDAVTVIELDPRSLPGDKIS